jgi:hypothetical protein
MILRLPNRSAKAPVKIWNMDKKTMYAPETEARLKSLAPSWAAKIGSTGVIKFAPR